MAGECSPRRRKSRELRDSPAGRGGAGGRRTGVEDARGQAEPVLGPEPDDTPQIGGASAPLGLPIQAEGLRKDRPRGSALRSATGEILRQ